MNPSDRLPASELREAIGTAQCRPTGNLCWEGVIVSTLVEGKVEGEPLLLFVRSGLSGALLAVRRRFVQVKSQQRFPPGKFQAVKKHPQLFPDASS